MRESNSLSLENPIVIVAALPSTPTVPFLQHELLTTTPIYISYEKVPNNCSMTPG